MDCEADTVRPFLKSDDRLYVAGIGKVNAAAHRGGDCVADKIHVLNAVGTA